MSQPNNHFDAEQRFVVEQYNNQAPFASFLPGIAGELGIPTWVFYVNRGQAIASFGTRNKDGAFLEFYPADKAYQLTARSGFRTFLKIHERDGSHCYEPFQRSAGAGVSQKLLIAAHEFSVEESNPMLGFCIRVDYFTLPQASLAGLVRRVSLSNLGASPKTFEIVDGLPQVLCYGLNQWVVKFMSRTHEAYIQVEQTQTRCPFYRLKVMPTDSPEVEQVEAGNFFLGILDGQPNPVIIDPERVFGLDDSLNQPEAFYQQALNFADQVSANRTPCAFQALSLELEPRETRVFYGLYGHAKTLQILQDFLPSTRQPNYFETKRAENHRLILSLTQRAYSATASPAFDAYASQCFLDNGLRGGFTHSLPGGVRLHLYGRKHGDLERDYNDFLIQDSPYSEGNGDFRDMLQNRRTDLYFDPAWGARDIRYFFQLVQPDGFNPCQLRNTRLWIAEERRASLLQQLPQLSGLEPLLAKPLKYAELWQFLQSNGTDTLACLEKILAVAEEVIDAEFDRGYWSDHWTYLVDLLESYAAIFPDQISPLLDEPGYGFFDPTHFVKPRSAKYVMTGEGLRQFDALQLRKDKIALINQRREKPYLCRDQLGVGKPVSTSLLGKILTLLVNKLASLDPEGVGVEMEADRPGWCDALNGLPGLLGSSINETCEIKRLADFALTASNATGSCALPAELASFLRAMQELLQQNLATLAFWEASHTLKESYREQVFMGFEGAIESLDYAEIRLFLSTTSQFLARSIAKAKTERGITSYYQYDASDYEQTEDGLKITAFRQTALPQFLEGYVHALRLATPEETRRLYQAAKTSPLYDRKLGMFRLNEPLGEEALSLGRIGIFNYGWLENGSIFLHMHAKFVLEMARKGLFEELYADWERLLLPFRDPAEYRRSPIENSSFLVSSGFTVDAREHGRGCVARLSGATVEFLSLWLLLFLGPNPFRFEQGRLRFQPQPKLSAHLFSLEAKPAQFLGNAVKPFPKDAAACALLGHTLLVYVNPSRKNCYGPEAAKPRRFVLYDQEGNISEVEGGRLDDREARRLREGSYKRLEIWLD